MHQIWYYYKIMNNPIPAKIDAVVAKKALDLYYKVWTESWNTATLTEYYKLSSDLYKNGLTEILFSPFPKLVHPAK